MQESKLTEKMGELGAIQRQLADYVRHPTIKTLPLPPRQEQKLQLSAKSLTESTASAAQRDTEFAERTRVRRITAP